MRWLDENSAQCVVTSPPYWGLRDYGISGQLGLEKTFDEYVERVVIIFREVRRVLRRDGTLWLNMGDCYNAGGRGGSHGGKSTLEGGQENQNASMRYPRKAPTTGVDVGGWNDAEIDGGARVVHHGLKPKDLVGMPWRIAFALQADGWWLRSEIIWEKPNPMPESVTDRPTRSHEQIFLLSKSARYYYDQDAIREPWADGRQGRDYPQPNAP
ncbi:MAG TPA: site-specific DNA-methyltransferase, partial [Methylomirabilota bacterium]|nr:site-specific DNA-methyltransferase [Methylomirabilota bacterium]